MLLNLTFIEQLIYTEQSVYVNNLLHVYIICSLLNSYCQLIN
jgi:hypothetical protein